MNLAGYLKWIHLIAAAVWTGGLITLAVSVTALRRADAPRDHLLAVARAFGRLSWTAFAVAVATGLWQVEHIGYGYGVLLLKISLVAAAGLLALVHQLTARHTSPALRGALQGVILIVSILIFGAAVRAFG